MSREMKVLLRAANTDLNENIIIKVKVVEILPFDHDAATVGDDIDHDVKVIEMERLLIEYPHKYIYTFTNDVMEINSVCYALFLPAITHLTDDMDVVNGWRKQYECPFIDFEPDQDLGFPVSWLLATHEIIATPCHIEKYTRANTTVCGGIIVTHRLGHRMLFHYHDQSDWYHDESSFINHGDSMKAKKIHYFGYYHEGSFRIVAQRSREHAETDRHLFKKLERNRLS